MSLTESQQAVSTIMDIMERKCARIEAKQKRLVLMADTITAQQRRAAAHGRQQSGGVIRIAKHLPMPKAGKAPANARFPWHSMEVGDSFLVRTLADAQSASRAARIFADYHGITFKTAMRTVRGGIRIWRTA